MTIENEEDCGRDNSTGFEYPLNKYTVKRGESICTSNIVRERCRY